VSARKDSRLCEGPGGGRGGGGNAFCHLPSAPLLQPLPLHSTVTSTLLNKQLVVDGIHLPGGPNNADDRV